MLEALGLSEDEERAYQRLVSRSSESAEDLAVALGFDAPVADAVLAELEDKGLVARSVADPGRFAASPPAVALGAMIPGRPGGLRGAQLELPPLAEPSRPGPAKPTLVDVIEV